jgi:hypothetical protein
MLFFAVCLLIGAVCGLVLPPPSDWRTPMRRPSDDELSVAALWLENNEGDESAACRNVALWLESQIAKSAENRAVRQITRQTGVSAARARDAFRRIQAGKQ